MKNIADPSLLVVVLNYRTAQMTLRAAEAALADMPARNAELIIVDNASGDGSATVLQQSIAKRGWDKGGRVRLILSEVNGGFGAGNNIGIRAGMSDGRAPDFIYIVNSDAFADPGCIAALMAHLRDHPQAGIAGSFVRGQDEAPHVTAFRFPSIAGEFEGAVRFGPVSRVLSRSIVAPPLPQTTTQVDWVAGASVLLRGEMLREIGLFDESYFLYFEETDLCLRAARAGWQCWYVPDSRIIHIGSVSTGMKTWHRMPTYWFDSRQRYFSKNHGRLYTTLALLARLFGGALNNLRCLLTRRKPQDPHRFLRDMMQHAIIRQTPAATRPIRRQISEDHS